MLPNAAFRVQQLQELDTAGGRGSDAARREVRRALRTAAWSALREIDAALRRIRQGSYGRCPRCGDALSVERLRALPMTACVDDASAPQLMSGHRRSRNVRRTATDTTESTTPSRGERHHDHGAGA